MRGLSAPPSILVSACSMFLPGTSIISPYTKLKHQTWHNGLGSRGRILQDPPHINLQPRHERDIYQAEPIRKKGITAAKASKNTQSKDLLYIHATPARGRLTVGSYSIPNANSQDHRSVTVTRLAFWERARTRHSTSLAAVSDRLLIAATTPCKKQAESIPRIRYCTTQNKNNHAASTPGHRQGKARVLREPNKNAGHAEKPV